VTDWVRTSLHGRLSAKFDPTLGVQCETCHGAGKDYRKKAIEHPVPEGYDPTGEGEAD
jgi:hypothetical protein